MNMQLMVAVYEWRPDLLERLRLIEIYEVGRWLLESPACAAHVADTFLTQLDRPAKANVADARTARAAMLRQEVA